MSKLKSPPSNKSWNASFKNGFGIQFPFAPSDVKSVTGYKHVSDYIKMSANGTEAGQQKAVIIPFDNYNALLNNSDDEGVVVPHPDPTIGMSGPAVILP